MKNIDRKINSLKTAKNIMIYNSSNDLFTIKLLENKIVYYTEIKKGIRK